MQNLGLLRAWGIFRTLSNIYDREFFLEPWITVTYGAIHLWHPVNGGQVGSGKKNSQNSGGSGGYKGGGAEDPQKLDVQSYN